MEYRYLGRSGLQVPVLSFGAGTFGGSGPLFSHWGQSDVKEARRLVDICLDHGVNLFDTADVYSNGSSEDILGSAVKGRRADILISTKLGLPMSDAPNDAGASRHHIIVGVEAALRRLNTDYIDILQLHALDAHTPAEETLSALDQCVRDGKVRYVGVSNYPGWQIMKLISAAKKHGWPRPIAHQVYYSLIGRDYEWDLMPLAADQGVGAMVWSPLGWGRLTGKIRRGAPIPQSSRLHETASFGPPVDQTRLYDLVDVMDDIAKDTGKTIPQIALNWLIQRPTIATVIMGARNEAQLLDNLGAAGWSLSSEHLEILDKLSRVPAPYPHFPYERQDGFARLNPPLV